MLYLSIGSNLGDRAHNLAAAVVQIETAVGHVAAASDVIETEPWGFRSANTFLNQALAVETGLSAEEVLTVTQQIEKKLGRTSKSHEGIYHDRIIDIDLLMMDDLVIDTDRLTLPHPLMTGRRFVLEPLAQIAPDAVHPILHLTVREILQNL